MRSWQGILYLAVGAGEGAWDSFRPIPLLTDTQLTREVGRIILTPEQIVFLDSANASSRVPSPRLEIIAQV